MPKNDRWMLASERALFGIGARTRALGNEVLQGLAERIEKEFSYKGESFYEVQRTVYPGENR